MKYIKILGLLAVAAASMMAIAASASATTVTSPENTVYTGSITAESHSAVTKLEGAFVTVECKKSHVGGAVEQHGTDKTVKGNLSALSFTECNFPVHVNPEKRGSLELHATGTGTNLTGTLTSSGAEVTVTTSLGTCVFTTNATPVGTVTPTNDTPENKGHATIDINSQPIPRTAGSFLCGNSGIWSGSYTVKTPSTLWIDS